MIDTLSRSVIVFVNIHLNIFECVLVICLLLSNTCMWASSVQCVVSCNVIQGVVCSLPSRRKSFLKCTTRWRSLLCDWQQRPLRVSSFGCKFCSIEANDWAHVMQFSPNCSLMILDITWFFSLSILAVWCAWVDIWFSFFGGSQL